MWVEVFLTTDDAAVSAVENKQKHQPFWPHFDTVGYLVFGFMVLSLFSRPFIKYFFVSYNQVGGIQFYSLCILCLRKTISVPESVDAGGLSIGRYVIYFPPF